MNYRIRADDVRPLSLNETDGLSSVLQNVSIILNTRQGTCPFFRDFGLTQEYIGRPINIAKNLLVSEIKEAIEIFEPRARVLEVFFDGDASQPEYLMPIVEVEINA